MKQKSAVFILAAAFLAFLMAPFGRGRTEDIITPNDTLFSSALVKPEAVVRAFSFSLKQVRLLPGPFKDAMERDLNYLLSLEPDRFLHTFRQNASLPSSADPYGGWEKPDGELRGHSTGHYISACALMYASTGNTDLKAKADYLVAELAKCQRALGPIGYLSAFPEEFFDRVFSVRRVWAPFYTLHKIMAGLLDMYEYCGNRQALEIAEKMAGWVKTRTDLSDDRHMEIVLNHTEQGGINEMLVNLYSLTGKSEYLKLARRFDEKALIIPLSQSRDELKGKHINSFIPNIIGTAREYEMTGDTALYNIAKFFWTQVTSARTYVTGGMGNHERWRTDPYVMATDLGTNNNESCCTYNMLKLTRHLFNWDADPCVADYYERALLNGILSTQNPKDGMMMYHTAMMSGMYKTFMTPENSFWCCTGTGMENHAKYGDSIYFHDSDGLYVNLYIASELNWPEKGLLLRQETNFPKEQGTTLIFSVEKPVDLELRIRIPSWIANGGYIKLNGKSIETFATPSSYVIMKRKWRTGDKIELSLPMDFHLERLPDNPEIAAILFGPVVMASPLGSEGMTEEAVYNQYAPKGDPVPVPELKVQDIDPNTWIDQVDAKQMIFKTAGVGNPNDILLIPFYELFDERYAVYWRVSLPGQKEQRKEKNED